MAKFKNERDWSDLERADKIALFVGIFMWALIETGLYYQNVHQMQNNAKGSVLKTLVVGHNR